MITRAQAEALLTLAESLEACAALDISLCAPGRDEMILLFGESSEEVELKEWTLTGTSIRLAVNSLVPNLEAPQVDKNCYWCFGDGITHPEQGVTYGGKRCTACKSADARGLPKPES